MISYYIRYISYYSREKSCSCSLRKTEKTGKTPNVKTAASLEIPFGVGNFLPKYDSILDLYRESFFSPDAVFSGDYNYQLIHKHIIKESWSF